MTNEQGFLSPAISEWVVNVKKQHKSWFDLASEINRESMAINDSVIPVPGNDRQLLGKLIYLRTLQFFQGAILLAERGMITEARTLVRSCAESSMALGGVARIDDFPAQLQSAHDKHRRGLAGFFVGDLETRDTLTEEQRSEINRQKSSLDNQTLQGITWEDVANRSDMDLIYNTVYRALSGDSAHVTMLALGRHVDLRGGGNPRIVFGPTDCDLSDTLSKAICSLLGALLKLHEIFPESAIESRLQPLLEKWGRLVESK